MRKILIGALLASCIATPTLSQDRELDRRIDRVEREVRALQRQVFPGGSDEFFEPEIQPGTRPGTVGTPASAPITDLTDRVNALERQLATLTGQIEENSYELRQLRAQVDALQNRGVAPESDDGFQPVEDPAADREVTETPDTSDAAETPDDETETASDTTTDTSTPFRSEGSEPPLPDDAGEASYVRGYRLWRDGNFAQARTQLRETIENFPGHRFESYARNLLGRAFLDDDKPANATEIFVRNYQELPNGERAADSLFFLGVALTELNYNDRACLAFDELEEMYGESLRSTIREQVPGARAAANCS